MGYVKESELFVKTDNKDKYNAANEFYYKVDLKNKKFLFTESDLNTAEDRAHKNLEDF